LLPAGFPGDLSPAIVRAIQTLSLANTKNNINGSTFMKRRSAIAMLAFGCAVLAYSPQASSETGWVTLFDGKSMDNFNKLGEANWRIEDGMIVADKGNGFLITKNEYNNYEIKAEFWVEADSNSGVFIRCTDPNKVGADSCYEVNIWDARPDPSYGTGAIVNVAKVDPMPHAAGKWNTIEITAKGPTFTVALNGQKTVDGASDSKLASGRVALQHGLGVKDANGVPNDKGVVKFRKVEIKPL
jgi:hypothetical protein